MILTKPVPLAAFLIPLLLLTQCSPLGAAGSRPDYPPPVNTAFPNPERGWYRSAETDGLSANALKGIREDNITLVAFEVNLGNYVAKPLDEEKLSEVSRAFSLARNAGLSVIFRAAYDFDGKNFPDPDNIDIVLNHISQLGPIFRANEDVLFNIQAGFLGSWGEWHSSNYSEPRKKYAPVAPEYQRILVNALLEAAPESVTIAVRRPEYVRNIAGKETLGPEEAFGPSKLARVAFHNDALMSTKGDMDTYIDPEYQPEEVEFAWINKHTRYTPFIGETNKVSEYNDTERAIPFLDLMNAHSLNFEYHPDVLGKWQTSLYDGMNAFDYISLHLGYRFNLRAASLSVSGEYGGSLRLDLAIENSGFGHLLKKKVFELVLKKGGQTLRAEIAEDARFWDKNTPLEGIYYFRLPAELSPGEWEAYLGLSSPHESLRDNPFYSVRFAGEHSWAAALGLNGIGVINLEPPAEGSGGTEFGQIIE